MGNEQVVKNGKSVEIEQAIEALWQESHTNKLYGQVACNKCGGGLSAKCQCARKYFVEHLSGQDFEKYLARDKNWKTTRAFEIDQLWLATAVKRKEIIEMDNMINLCNICKQDDALVCLCAKERFVAHLILPELEQFLNKNKD